MVPEVEEREAARFTGFNWRDWKELPVVDRVDCVAYYRLRRVIEANEEDAREKEVKRRTRAKK